MRKKKMEAAAKKINSSNTRRPLGTLSVAQEVQQAEGDQSIPTKHDSITVTYTAKPSVDV
jgi:hypothetical protein